MFHGLERMAAFYAERARGGVGLIVTGGIAPNDAGRGYPGAAKLSTAGEARPHEDVTAAVHAEGGKIALQILHTGRYAYHPFPVAPSAIKAPIGWATPAELTDMQVRRTIADYARTAELAKRAGYDGVEVRCCVACVASPSLPCRQLGGDGLCVGVCVRVCVKCSAPLTIMPVGLAPRTPTAFSRADHGQ